MTTNKTSKITKTNNEAAVGHAEVGTRAGLNKSIACLQRTWRSGRGGSDGSKVPQMIEELLDNNVVKKIIIVKWAEQDSTRPGKERVIGELGKDGWIRAQWDNCTTNSYRMSKLLGQMSLSCSAGLTGELHANKCRVSIIASHAVAFTRLGAVYIYM
ncbi:hypothetical protein HCN44_003498 [Aphidius gifuensis]|uniref:Uncharacterized protein n=1 Tax=Aphidius gifuensis TaxID=684658 RepID=A0A835CP13_APHGI|nr:hypothetical protein HCN44_003498 [Aphidius gifuensis]